MKKNILLLLIFFSVFLIGQNLQEIRKEVSKINTSKNFKIKTVPNDYFVDVKKSYTDNGQDLKGYYQDGKLKKMIHAAFLSAQKIVFEYYILNGKLIFVNENVFQIRGGNGYLKKPQLIFEGKYYFNHEKLFKKTETGRKLSKNDLLKDYRELFRALKNY